MKKCMRSYERSEIDAWLLQTNIKSPLDPSKRMSLAELTPSRAFREANEVIIMTRGIKAGLIGAWKAKKKCLDLKKVQDQFDEGEGFRRPPS